LIYDFETLSQRPEEGVAVCIAALNYDSGRFSSDNPYTYQELVDMCGFMKFDVQEQVSKYGRTIQKSTLDWWKKQGAEARKLLQPSDEDQSIENLYDFYVNKHLATKVKRIYTRGNTFDPVFMGSLFKSLGFEDPTPWWVIRDTRSYIDGLTVDTVSDKFIPDDIKDKFVAHDPMHDIAMDVYRIQYIIRMVLDK